MLYVSACLESRGVRAFILDHLFKDAGVMKTALEDRVYLRSREQVSFFFFFIYIFKCSYLSLFFYFFNLILFYF